MTTPMNAYAKVANRFGVDPSDDDAIDAFFLRVVPLMPAAQKEEILAELLGAIGATPRSAETPLTGEPPLHIPLLPLEASGSPPEPTSRTSRVAALRAILERMSPGNLAELHERLLYFSQSLLQLHGPRARHFSFTGEDLVNEAFTAALRGERLCPEGTPLFVFFARTIRNLLARELEHRELAFERVAIDGGDEEADTLELPAGDDVEASILAGINLEEFRAALDDELREYVDLLVAESGSTAEELAQKMGKPVRTIRSLNRKIARRRAQWNPH